MKAHFSRSLAASSKVISAGNYSISVLGFGSMKNIMTIITATANTTPTQVVIYFCVEFPIIFVFVFVAFTPGYVFKICWICSDLI
jgi:hypothetical protein